MSLLLALKFLMIRLSFSLKAVFVKPKVSLPKGAMVVSSLVNFTHLPWGYATLSDEVPDVNSVIRRREDLRLLEGTEVVVSGRVKEFRRHEKRRDLDTVLLVNLIVTPTPLGESIFLSHLWFLRRQFKKLGRIPEQSERVVFYGEVYSYRRLGGRSIDRGLFNSTDYGIKPVRYED